MLFTITLFESLFYLFHNQGSSLFKIKGDVMGLYRLCSGRMCKQSILLNYITIMRHVAALEDCFLNYSQDSSLSQWPLVYKSF